MTRGYYKKGGSAYTPLPWCHVPRGKTYQLPLLMASQNLCVSSYASGISILEGSWEYFQYVSVNAVALQCQRGFGGTLRSMPHVLLGWTVSRRT